jgi:hypothetical protein
MAKLFPQFVLLIESKTDEIEILDESLDRCQSTLKMCRSDSEYVYSVVDKQHDVLMRDRRRDIIRTTLFAGGAAIVGVGVGILIGVFAI